MQVYLTQRRWDALRLMRVAGRTHPRPLDLILVQGRLRINEREAKLLLDRMAQHGILAKVGTEYRATQLGARLLRDTDTMTINDVTFELLEVDSRGAEADEV